MSSPPHTSDLPTTEAQAFANHIVSDPMYSNGVSRDTLHALIAYAFAHGALAAATEAVATHEAA